MAGTAVAIVMLGGCTNALGSHDVVTAADRHRLAVMRADPVFGTTVPKTGYSVVGELWGTDSWRRGQVSATIYQRSAPAATLSPLPVQAFVRGLLAGMQSRGWVAYYSTCDFDRQDSGSDGPAEWHDVVYAYRIYQGVSYWANLRADANESNGPHLGFVSDVSITMIVPAASERPDLFSDHPAGIPVGSVCAAQPHQLPSPVMQGSPILVTPESDRIDPAAPGPADTDR